VICIAICDSSGGIGSTLPRKLGNLPDLIFLGQFLKYSSNLSTSTAVLHIQCGSAAERQCHAYTNNKFEFVLNKPIQPPLGDIKVLSYSIQFTLMNPLVLRLGGRR
jgi:hypothetical protein